MSGTAELGVIADTGGSGRLAQIALGSDELVLVTSMAGPLAGRKRVALEESLAFPFIGLTEGRTEEQHHAAAARPPGPRLNYRIRFPAVDAVCAAVAAGVGVSVLPERAVRERMNQHDVCVVGLDDAWARREMLLCARDFDDLSGAARVLAGFLASAEP